MKCKNYSIIKTEGLKTNKSKTKTTKVRYNYYITETKRLKCEKIDKTIIEIYLTTKQI
jgi:hypothetical protein